MAEPAEQPPFGQFAQDLRAALDEHFASHDHRKAAEEIDLSGLERLPPQVLHIRFGAPEQVMLHAATGVLRDHIPNTPETALDALTDTYNRTVTDFLQERQQEGWSHRRQIGDVTVVFDEAPAEEQSANPDISGFYDPQDITGTLAVNGKSFALRGGGAELLSGCLPQLLEWMETVGEVEQREEQAFHDCITLEAIDNIRVTPYRGLTLGTHYLRGNHGKAAQAFVLHHEMGHVANRQTQEVLDAAYAKLDFAFLPRSMTATLMETPTEALAAHMLDTFGSLGEAQEELYAAHGALEDIAPHIRKAAAHVRAYPWLDTLDGLAVAADAANPTSFAAHMHGATATPPQEEAADTLLTYLETLDGSGEGLAPDNGELAVLAADIDAMKATHAPLHADVQLLHDCAQYLSQAKEYLADLHATKALENPAGAAEFFRDTPRSPVESTREHTHPQHHQREEACTHFATRILRERERSGGQQHSR